MDVVYMLLGLLAAITVALLLATRLAPERMTRLGLGLERWRGGLHARRATVDGFDMPYLDGGSGEPLLLIHGFGGDKDNFTLVARFLTPHYRVLIPDLPGFGEAGRDPAATYLMADQVARLHALLEQLGITRLHVGGNSMGGFIAAQFAATYPDMVASVWLLDAAGTEASHDTPLLRHYEATGEMPLLLRHESDYEALLAATTFRRPFVPHFVRRVMARRGVADFAFHTRLLQQLQQSPLLETMYSKLATPALIVWGAQDRILHLNGAGALKSLFVNASVRIMDGIGHLPMIEAPKESAQDYLAFRRTLAA